MEYVFRIELHTCQNHSVADAAASRNHTNTHLISIVYAILTMDLDKQR